MQKVAVLLYLYHTSMWDELFFLLEDLKNIKLYIAVNEHIDTSVYAKQCNETFKDVVFTKVKAKGLDLYPFVQQIELLDSKETPFFIKLHTKRSIIQDKNFNFDWSNILIHSVIGSSEALVKNIQILQDNEQIGALCLENFILTHNETIHRDKIIELCKYFKIPYNSLQNSSMMAGSIFYGKTECFQKIFNKKNTNILKNYLEEIVSTQPTNSTYTHAFECVLSYLILHSGLSILPCYIDSIKIYNKQIDKNINLIRTYTGLCYIQENPLLNGTVVKQTEKEIHIKWKNTIDSNIQIYKKDNTEIYYRDEPPLSQELFNAVEYKSVNIDLLHLTNEEAEEHYFIHGIKEGRPQSHHEIEAVFDSKFYAKEYKTDTPLNDFLTKGRFENRIYNPIVLNNTFDYGFYISYKNLLQINNSLDNQYKALRSYINKKDKTKEKCNNIINTVNTYNVSNKTLCIYIGYINNRQDEYFIQNDLEVLNETCDVYIILNTKSKYIKSNKIKPCTKSTWEFDCYLEALKSSIVTNDYKNVVLLTNKTTLLFSLKTFISTFESSGLDFMSLTDSNTKHIYSNKYVYHLHMDCIIFNTINKKTIVNFLQEFVKTNITYTIAKVYEFEFTQNLIKQKKTFGALLTPSKELELLWNELLTVEINQKPELLFKHKVPAIQKHLLFYFKQLKTSFIKKANFPTRFQPRAWLEYTRHTDKLKYSKIACILHVHTLTNVGELKDYIEILTNKCNIDFFITGKQDVYDKIYNKKYSMCFIETKNKGMDIGPFLYTLQYFKDKNLQYDYIIKLQEKKTTHWRRYLFTNIIENLEQYIDFLSEKDVSFTGAKSYLYPLDDLNKDTINHFLIRNNIPFNYEIESQYNGFFAGTMFIMKYSTFTDFIEKYKIDLVYEYEILEEGAVTNEFATNTHAWERILSCVIPTVQNTKLKCI